MVPVRRTSFPAASNLAPQSVSVCLRDGIACCFNNYTTSTAMTLSWTSVAAAVSLFSIAASSVHQHPGTIPVLTKLVKLTCLASRLPSPVITPCTVRVRWFYYCAPGCATETQAQQRYGFCYYYPSSVKKII